MSATSREIVFQTLNFEAPERAPRQLWLLPYAVNHHPDELERLKQDYPPDIDSVPGFLREEPPRQGDPFVLGTSVDEWGCTFVNLQAGVQGEVKDPIVKDWERDADRPRFPREWLTISLDEINRRCAETERFTMAGSCPRPFERLQFLRGSADLYIDLLMQPPAMVRFAQKLHAFYCELLEAWAKTDVDSLVFMDDWGSQRSLLIDPAVWKDFFKPMYRDYIQIAHGAGKKIFMHSDGYIVDIYPELIELGLDAINSQVFCMGIDTLAQFAGRITFWGEIDRQHILPEGTREDVRRAVREFHAKLWKNGGCFAQCEFGPGAKPENVREVFAAWEEMAAVAS